jgi:alkylhydroperoxidase/carboxymuconolactone decarboxylase family protein YurZ
MVQPVDGRIMRHLVDSCDQCPGKEFFYGPFLSAAIAGRDEAAMRLIMKTALDDFIPAAMIDEIILQSHLFLGFPAMIEAARIFAAVNPQHHNRDYLPEPYSADECRDWNRDGLEKIRSIYGPAFDRLVHYINSFSPRILTWMINDGYGQVLSRPGASFALRELSVVATLTVTSYVNQLGAHIRGALNVGVDSGLIGRTMDNCRYFCSRAKIRAARKILVEATGA